MDKWEVGGRALPVLVVLGVLKKVRWTLADMGANNFFGGLECQGQEEFGIFS